MDRAGANKQEDEGEAIVEAGEGDRDVVYEEG